LRGIRRKSPVDDVLDGRQVAGGAGEADIGDVPPDGGGNVDGVTLCSRLARDGVGDEDGERRAVIGHVDMERVAAVEVEPGAGQVDGTDVFRYGAVAVQARRGGPLAVVAE